MAKKSKKKQNKQIKRNTQVKCNKISKKDNSIAKGQVEVEETTPDKETELEKDIKKSKSEMVQLGSNLYETLFKHIPTQIRVAVIFFGMLAVGALSILLFSAEGMDMFRRERNTEVAMLESQLQISDYKLELMEEKAKVIILEHKLERLESDFDSLKLEFDEFKKDIREEFDEIEQTKLEETTFCLV